MPQGSLITRIQKGVEDNRSMDTTFIQGEDEEFLQFLLVEHRPKRVFFSFHEAGKDANAKSFSLLYNTLLIGFEVDCSLLECICGSEIV